MSIGPVMLDVEGLELSQEDKNILSHPAVGGLILFSRNYRDTKQLTELVKSIRASSSKNLLISVDHEGGRVQRFKDGFTRLPPMRRMGELYDRDPKAAKQLATDTAWLLAVELRCHDIDFSFAPVSDLDYGQCSVIGDRAFHSTPEAVYELNYAFCHGLEQAGMASVAKHFPGHGFVGEDSHVEVPVDEREYDVLYRKDIHPFRLLIQNNLTAIMPAHIIYSKVDASPAGFSRHWLQTVLREQLGFNGVIFSDDLNMQGASVAGEHYSDRADAALKAGCDMILVCNNRAGAINVLDNIKDYSDPVSASRLTRMHGRKPVDWFALQQTVRWHEVKKQLRDYTDNPVFKLV